MSLLACLPGNISFGGVCTGSDAVAGECFAQNGPANVLQGVGGLYDVTGRRQGVPMPASVPQTPKQ